MSDGAVAWMMPDTAIPTGLAASRTIAARVTLGANLASRLEQVNKAYGTHWLVSEATARGAETVVEMREIDRLTVSGQSQPQTIFETMGLKGALSEPQEMLRSRYV